MYRRERRQYHHRQGTRAAELGRNTLGWGWGQERGPPAAVSLHLQLASPGGGAAAAQPAGDPLLGGGQAGRHRHLGGLAAVEAGGAQRRGCLGRPARVGQRLDALGAGGGPGAKPCRSGAVQRAVGQLLHGMEERGGGWEGQLRVRGWK